MIYGKSFIVDQWRLSVDEVLFDRSVHFAQKCRKVQAINYAILHERMPQLFLIRAERAIPQSSRQKPLDRMSGLRSRDTDKNS
jgi:hypothetical protein